MKKYSLIILIYLPFIINAQVLSDKEYFNRIINKPNKTHIIGSQSYLNNTTEGDYSVWFGCGGNALHAEITKPFIWVVNNY